MNTLEMINFEDIISIQQDLHFSTLEQELIQKTGITCFNSDIIKVFGLCTIDNYYNNAAALLADENSFKGIELTRYRNNIHEMYYQKIYDNISILTILKYVIDEYRMYYQYEIIKSLIRETIEEIPEKLFIEAIVYAIVNHSWDNNDYIKIMMLKDMIKIIYPTNKDQSLTNPTIFFLLQRLGYIKNFSHINSMRVQTNNSVVLTLPVVKYTS